MLKKILYGILAVVVLIFVVYMVSDYYMTDADSLAFNDSEKGSWSKSDFYQVFLERVIENQEADEEEPVQSVMTQGSSSGSATSGNINVTITGGTMKIPDAGELIQCTEINTKQQYNVTRVVPDSFAWEMSVNYTRNNYKTLSQRMDKAKSVSSSDNEKSSTPEMLYYEIDGLKCYAGAVVDGFVKPGDIVEVTLDNSSKFYMIIIDVKSLDDAKGSGAALQIDSVYGHGYLNGSRTTVSMCMCEFFWTTGGYKDAAKSTEFVNLTSGRHVTSMSIVKNVF